MSNFRQTLLIAGVACLISPQVCFAVDQDIAARKAFIHSLLAKCYMAKHMGPDAAKEYAALLKYTPGDARLYFDYANALILKGDKRGALTQFRQAAKLQPGVPEYAGAVGALALNLGMYDLSVLSYTRAVSLGGNFQGQLQQAQQYQAQERQRQAYIKQQKQQQQDSGETGTLGKRKADDDDD